MRVHLQKRADAGPDADPEFAAGEKIPLRAFIRDFEARMSETASSLQGLGVAGGGFEALMPPVRPRPRLLTFGVFEFDCWTGELRKEGRLIHLRHQPASVLQLLLEGSGDLVTRRQITDLIWADDVDVDVEQGLNHCMKEIRAALGDRPASPRFIQTLPRRGYRLLVEVHARARTPGRAQAPSPETVEPVVSREPESELGGPFE